MGKSDGADHVFGEIRRYARRPLGPRDPERPGGSGRALQGGEPALELPSPSREELVEVDGAGVSHPANPRSRRATERTPITPGRSENHHGPAGADAPPP